MYYTQNSYVCFECNSVLGKGGPQRRDSYRKASALTPGAQTCALPRPTFLRQHMLPSSFKREDDGREGAISGRLARKATGVSPSSFARIGVFAGKWYLQISPETIVQKHDAGRFPRRRGGSVEVWRCFPEAVGAGAGSGGGAVQSANQPIQLISRRSVGAPTALRSHFPRARLGLCSMSSIYYKVQGAGRGRGRGGCDGAWWIFMRDRRC